MKPACFRKPLIVLLGSIILISTDSIGQRIDSTFTKSLPLNPINLTIGSKDSAYSAKLSFRIQNRILMNTESDEDLNPQSWEARVRRLRLGLRGHLLHERLTYRLQLSFSRADMDWNATDQNKQNVSPNAVRDAMINFQATKNWNIGFGQTKLPGNRQRVVSSGALQFYDRSPVNSNFNLDRDFGLFSDYVFNLSSSEIHWKSAITTGEGRNSSSSNGGLAYTGKLEILVFGKFAESGDYFEGDLLREKTPKLSVSAGYHFNDLAVRTNGQTGQDLDAPKSFQVFFGDILFKYRGFALSSEYMKRQSLKSAITGPIANPIHLVVGQGINSQISYCFPSMWEIAGRYSWLKPDSEIRFLLPKNEQIGLGLSRYLMRHKLKAQFNVFYNKDTLVSETGDNSRQNWIAVFQMELGI